MKQKSIDSAKRLSNLAPFLAMFLIALQAVFIFIPAKFLLILIIPIFNFLLFFISKDFQDDKIRSTHLKILYASYFLFWLDLIFLIKFFIGRSISGSAPIGLIIVIAVFTVLINILLLTGKGVKEKIRDLSEKNSFSSLLKVDVKSNGDCVICKNLETKEDVVIPYKDRFLHSLILGPTGSGKTSQIIIPMINQDIQNLDAGLTVIEPKGDLAEKVMALAKYYKRPAVYFNPVDPDCPYFNPLDGQETEVIENMVTAFKMLNPDSPQFFQDMSETFLRNALKVVKRVKGDKATLNDLFRLAADVEGQGKEMVNTLGRLSGSVEWKKENSEVASWFNSDYFNIKSKTYEHCSGVRNQIAKIISNDYLRKVLDPPDGKSDVNFTKVLEENGVLAITTAQGKLRSLGRYLGYFIILNFQSAVFTRPGNENTRSPHFLYIDEFQTYANEGFEDMLTQGRSYRVSSNLATQNRALIGMGVGRKAKDFVQLVSTNARNVIIFPGANADDAKYYSEEFGDIVTMEVQKSVSRPRMMLFNRNAGWGNESFREIETIKDRFRPSEIIYRKFGEITYRTMKNATVQIPSVGLISFIPKELNDRLDEMINEHNETQERKRQLEEYEKRLNINKDNAPSTIDPMDLLKSYADKEIENNGYEEEDDYDDESFIENSEEDYSKHETFDLDSEEEDDEEKSSYTGRVNTDDYVPTEDNF